MLLDTLCQLDNDHAYTAAAISTNVLDLGPVTSNLTRDIAAGQQLYLSILITTTVTTNVSTVFTLESDDNTSLSSATVHWTGNTVLLASLIAGYWYAKAVALPLATYERYVGIRMTPSTSWGAGKASAWVHADKYNTFQYARESTNSV